MLTFHSTRLAPSPTGALHLGHARTFMITWLLARQAGAKIYMRMEDLDAGRAKPEAVQQAYDDLRWLGLDWDPFEEPPASPNVIPHSAFRIPHSCEVVQSTRLALYQATLESLWHNGHIYPCICTRADIAAAVAGAASAPHDAETPYPGTCRDRFPPFAATGQSTLHTAAHILTSTGKPPCFRLRVPSTQHSVLSTQYSPPAFTDLLAGTYSAPFTDFPLSRFAQDHPATPSPPHPVMLPPAYQLACVADDHAMAIDMVIRGDDLLPSTPRQIALYRALHWQPPRFAHLPLVVGTDGRRLAKRHGESRIAQFRAAGVSPNKILGWAAWRSGQIPAPTAIDLPTLLKIFNPTLIPKNPIILTHEDLAWLS